MTSIRYALIVLLAALAVTGASPTPVEKTAVPDAAASQYNKMGQTALSQAPAAITPPTVADVSKPPETGMPATATLVENPTEAAETDMPATAVPVENETGAAETEEATAVPEPAETPAPITAAEDIKPKIVWLDVKNERHETGGEDGCFGLEGDAKLLALPPNVIAVHYPEYGCKGTPVTAVCGAGVAEKIHPATKAGAITPPVPAASSSVVDEQEPAWDKPNAVLRFQPSLMSEHSNFHSLGCTPETASVNFAPQMRAAMAVSDGERFAFEKAAGGLMSVRLPAPAAAKSVFLAKVGPLGITKCPIVSEQPAAPPIQQAPPAVPRVESPCAETPTAAEAKSPCAETPATADETEGPQAASCPSAEEGPSRMVGSSDKAEQRVAACLTKVSGLEAVKLKELEAKKEELATLQKRRAECALHLEEVTEL